MTTDQRLENEIAHGKHLTSVWKGAFWYWDTPTGKIRYARRCKMLSDHIRPEMQVLEVGCGSGYFTQSFAKTSANITAIDISPDLLEEARKRVDAPNVEFKVENAYGMDCPVNFYDTIIGSSILHHLDLEKALKEFIRVLKPGGTIYFTEPNMMNPHIFLERHSKLIRKWLHVSPDETAFIRKKLIRDMERHGYTNIQIVHFDFLHPITPKFLIPVVQFLGDLFEKTPLISQISGSLYICAQKPA